MADQVEAKGAETKATESKGKGLSMPTNPALALQEMMREQMQEPTGTSGGAAVAPPVLIPESDSKTVRRIDGETERKIGSKKVGKSASKTDSQSERKEGSEIVSKEDGEEVRQTAASEKLPQEDTAAKPRRMTERAKSAALAKAESLARELAATPMKSVGLKMPEGLHDWLDDCQHRLKKQGILKQDLLRRALQLLVIEIEAGEKLADLEG